MSKLLLRALALAALGIMLTAQVAHGSHVRPRGATPLRVPLVPAFKQCTAPNSTHGAPLSFPSCNPPQHLNPYTTIGTPDANGAGANFVGSFQLKVIPGDVRITVTASDIRCLPGTAATVCNSANAVDGPDYSGDLQLTPLFRITDHGGPGGEAVTVSDLPLTVGSNGSFPCQDTSDTTVGGQCGVATTYNAGIPGAVVGGRRTIWELSQIVVLQSGASGHEQGFTFLKEGVFVP